MFDNDPSPAKEKQEDRRVRRTRQQLGRALMELALRKRYARITVQNILDHADVGRSTFYAHFRDKEDLLLKNFERTLALVTRHPDLAAAADDRALPPTLAFFRHAGDHHRLYRALARGGAADLLFRRAMNF